MRRPVTTVNKHHSNMMVALVVASTSSAVVCVGKSPRPLGTQCK